MYKSLYFRVYCTNYSKIFQIKEAVAAYSHLWLPQRRYTALHEKHIPYIQVGRPEFESVEIEEI